MEKARSGKVQRRDFATTLGNPARAAGLPLFHRPDHGGLTFRLRSPQKRIAELQNQISLYVCEDKSLSARRSAIQLQVKTILNQIQRYAGFVYAEVRMRSHHGQAQEIEIKLEAHAGMRGRCSQCQRSAPGYDRLAERRWLQVPLWNIPTCFRYAPRRVECAEHGVVVEHLPWSVGKHPITCAMMIFLACWGRRLSWRETARVFQTSWEAVYRSVEWMVQWGLAHRQLQGVESVGVDEIHWGRGLKADNFLTVLYQIDKHCRRLLWVGKRRSEATLKRGLKVLGPEVVKGLRFACSDMWKPYLKVIAAQAGQALHVLDRFHITRASVVGFGFDCGSATLCSSVLLIANFLVLR